MRECCTCPDSVDLVVRVHLHLTFPAEKFRRMALPTGCAQVLACPQIMAIISCLLSMQQMWV
ncbi:MAG: hypothetical protein ABGX16_00340 [Pirellulales bacterium]